MKDLPHHMKKLNRRIIRSIHHMEMEEADYDSKMPAPPVWKTSATQARKKAKIKMRDETNARAPTHPSDAERNQKMKHRVPIFDRTSHPRPKYSKPGHKKTPRI